MLKIGDFSKLSRIGIRMLRHYDEIGLLVPAEVDKFTGYRYYSEHQLLAADKIQALKSMGFGLAVIGDILQKYQDAGELERFLLIRRGELEEQEQTARERLRLLDNTLNCLRKDGNLMNYNVILKTLPERAAASVRQVLPSYREEGRLWQIMNSELAGQKVQLGNPGYGLAVYHDKEFKEQDVDVEIQIAVVGEYRDTEHVRFKKVPAIQTASATFQGSYEQITAVSRAVAAWVNENGYEFDGPSFCIYHVGPKDTGNPEAYVTEVCYPVSKK